MDVRTLQVNGEAPVNGNGHATSRIETLVAEGVRADAITLHSVRAEVDHALALVGSALHLQDYWRDRCLRFEHGDRGLMVHEAPLHFPDSGVDLEAEVANFERRYLTRALLKTNGLQQRAAKLLGISFRSLRYKLKKYDMLPIAETGPARPAEPDSAFCVCGRKAKHQGRCKGYPSHGMVAPEFLRRLEARANPVNGGRA